MHGLKRMPVGVVLAHAVLLGVGYFSWVGYLATDRAAIYAAVADAVVDVDGIEADVAARHVLDLVEDAVGPDPG